MSTPTTTPIDIPLMLWRLVPSAEYQWKGNGYGVYADIGEWRSPEITEPTESEIYAEWDVYLSELSADEATAAAIASTITPLVGVSILSLTSSDLNKVVIAMLYHIGAIDRDGKVRAYNLWWSK